MLARAARVLREEGPAALLSAGARSALRSLRLYPELTVPRALSEMERLWPEQRLPQPLAGEPRASVILLTYNGLDVTRLCLRSLAAVPAGAPFELVLVDNASSDGTPEYLTRFSRRFPNSQLLLNDSNLGFAAGNNAGAARASARAMVFLNNDTVVTPGWLAALLAHLDDPAAGMVGPRTNAWGNQARLDKTPYTSLAGLQRFAEERTAAYAGQSFEIPMLGFFCAALRREAWQQVGPLDERFGMGTFEDDDYALRVRRAGLTIRCAEDAFIHHWGSASFNRLEDERRSQLFEENRRKFEEKWGVTWRSQAS